MSRDLLIDGYNLLHAAGLARRTYGPGDLERCRRNLLELIGRQMSDEQRRRTTFVFDAKDPPPDADRHGTHAEMLILYAERDEEADDMIERLIAGHSAPRQLVVVSSDHRLHKAARRRKAAPIDSDAFLDECARRVYCRRAPRSEPEVKPGCDTSLAAIEEWLAVFDIDPHDVADSEIKLPESSRTGSSAKSDVPQPPGRTARRKSSRRALPERTSPPQPVEDVAFWEARIADLFRRHPDEFGDDR
jgi:predicted RNA-binding protein with PIN domain